MAEIAFVTGCASGIGRALALELRDKKTPDGKLAYHVVATDINYEALRSLEEEDRVSIGRIDVTKQESIREAVQTVLAKHGRIDLLVCNAGISKNGWLAEMPFSFWEQMFSVNVHGVFKVIQEVAPHMMERKSGKIAVMTSVNSWVVRPACGPYSATKAAVALMADSLRMELLPFGVQVVKIIPGWVKSDLLRDVVPNFMMYDTPKSRYQICTGHITKMVASFTDLGIPPEQAAQDMVNDLSVAKPPAVIKTGIWLKRAFFWGFVQQYMSLDRASRDLLKDTGVFYLRDHLRSKQAAQAVTA